MSLPHQMSLPITKFKIQEVKWVIQNEINPKKIIQIWSSRILKELSQKTKKAVTQIFNAIIKLSYFPSEWKVAEIIMIPKPSKPLEEVTSYRTISLLPVSSKVFEKLLLKRLKPILDTEINLRSSVWFQKWAWDNRQVRMIVNTAWMPF